MSPEQTGEEPSAHDAPVVFLPSIPGDFIPTENRSLTEIQAQLRRILAAHNRAISRISVAGTAIYEEVFPSQGVGADTIITFNPSDMEFVSNVSLSGVSISIKTDSSLDQSDDQSTTYWSWGTHPATTALSSDFTSGGELGAMMRLAPLGGIPESIEFFYNLHADDSNTTGVSPDITPRLHVLDPATPADASQAGSTVDGSGGVPADWEGEDYSTLKLAESDLTDLNTDNEWYIEAFFDIASIGEDDGLAFELAFVKVKY